MNSTIQMYLDRLSDAEPGSAGAASAPQVAGGKRFVGRLSWLVVAMLCAHAAETATLLASWACIGAGALSGRIDAGWLAAWALGLVTLIPLHAISTWLQGLVSVRAGETVKTALLDSALSIEVAHEPRLGSGALLSRVLDADAIDDLAASGGVVTLLAAVELLLAPLVFMTGAAPASQFLVLVAWTCVAAAMIWRNLRRRSEWTWQRLAMSTQLVEQLTAHRTRSAQLAPKSWHLDEDAALQDYVRASRVLDASASAIEAALPRGYVILATAALAPSFLAGNSSLAQLAVTFGAILYTASALERFCFGYARAAAAWVGWRALSSVLPAALRPRRSGTGNIAVPKGPALHIRGLAFALSRRHIGLFSGFSTTLQAGDKVLLQGHSGTGKSMLASIMAGSLDPTAGVVLLAGFDRQSLGAIQWRSHVVLVPQYHENHLFAASLLANLLLSKAAAYGAQDVAEATAVCRELGLGELVTRMPRGLHQPLGDAGWRVSQGERSRILLARALLQRPDVVILDGCFAALDPQCLRQCIDVVLRRTRTVIVIATP